MKGLKKIISVILCIVILFGSAPIAGFVELKLMSLSDVFGVKAAATTKNSGTCGKNLTWSFDETTCVLVISGFGAMEDYFFSTQGNLSVTKAPWGKYYLSIKSVIIDNGVTTIGKNAFCGCTSLSEITIGNSVTSIGESAFENCNSLENVYYTSDLAGWCGIEFKRLTSSNPMSYAKNLYINGVLLEGDVIIPDGVTSIGNFTFYNCDDIVNLTIPDSVTSFGGVVFWYCDNLETVTIGNGVKNIGDVEFCGCKNLEYVHVPASVTNIGDNMLLYTYAYICSETENCYAKSYANKSDIEFKTCAGHRSDGHSHISGEWVTIAEPSCSNEGKKLKCCTSCGDVLKTELIDMLGHNIIIDEAVESTCTETGLTEGQHCSRCDDMTVEQDVVPVKGHDIVIDEAVDATCTETGLTEGEHCSRCDDVTIEQEVVPALNHKGTLVQIEAQAPTCTEIGWDGYEYCTACDYTTYIEKEALDHDIVIDKVVASTCTETGLTEGQHCSRCDDVTVEQETVPVKAHNYIDKNDSTKHWKECSCGSKIDEQNHSFVSGNICSCGYRRVVNATLFIKNNTGSKTINYGETLKLTAIVNNKPYDAKIYWYVDGVLMAEGEIYNVSFDSGTKIVTAKLVDSNGYVLQDTNGNEIFDSEEVTVKSGFIQKIISFFKNLFGANRTIVQAFKVIF